MIIAVLEKDTHSTMTPTFGNTDWSDLLWWRNRLGWLANAEIKVSNVRSVGRLDDGGKGWRGVCGDGRGETRCLGSIIGWVSGSGYPGIN